MSPAQLLQITIAAGSASSLIFRNFAGSIPRSDTFFHIQLLVKDEQGVRAK